MDETVNEYRLLMIENVIYNDEVDNDDDNELVETILLIAEQINEEIEETLLITENSDKRYDALMKATGGKWNSAEWKLKGGTKQRAFMRKFTYDSKTNKFLKRKTGIKGYFQRFGKNATAHIGKLIGGKKIKANSDANYKKAKGINKVSALIQNARTRRAMHN